MSLNTQALHRQADDEFLTANPDLMTRAIYIAQHAHLGRLDDCGQPYLGHPKRVAKQLDDELDMVVALLHDVPEDHGDIWPLERLAQWFPEELILDLDAVTRRKGEETYREFIERVAQRPRATRVKRADLKDNMDPARVAGLAPEKQGIVQRYQKAVARLAEVDA